MFGNMKKILLGIMLIGGIMNGSCAESDDIKPFLNAGDVYSCMDSLETRSDEALNSIDIIKQRIEATKTFFLSSDLSLIRATGIAVPDFARFVPGEAEWRRSKLVEALSGVQGCFSDLEILPFCTSEIVKLCSLPETDLTKVKDKNFRCARYLLMSQCSEYNEAGNIYDLRIDCNTSVISAAVSTLQSAVNGDKEKSLRLLASLKASRSFPALLGE